MFARVNGTGNYRYVQLVENHRQGRRTVQRVLCSLGRLEQIQSDGSIDVLLSSLARFSQRMELKERRKGGPEGGKQRSIGSAAKLPRSGSTKAEALRVSPVFSDLKPDQLSELAQITREVRLKTGQFLFHEGDVVDSFCVVASGRVRVFMHSPSGRDFVITFVGPGTILGNPLLYYGKVHPCSNETMTETRVLAIENRDFARFLSRHPESGCRVLRKMLSIAGARMGNDAIRLVALASAKAGQRVAHVLLALSNEFGLTIRYTRQQIAEMAGTSTETAIRCLVDLKVRGIVDSGRGRVTVLDQAKLQLLAGHLLIRGKANGADAFK